MDEIKVYTDNTLMELGNSFAMLQSEETNFFLDKNEVNHAGRTMKNVAEDMIALYEKTNEHLKTAYPNNTVAESWIAVNNLSARLLRETWI